MEEDPNLVLYLTVIGLAATAGVGFFFAIQHFLAWASGWKKLAAAYPASGEPPGTPFQWRSARIGGLAYNNCVNMVAGRDGLYLAMNFFLRFGHAPVYLPWRELTVAPFKGWVAEYLVLTAARTPAVEIRMWRPRAEELLRAAGQPLPPRPPR